MRVARDREPGVTVEQIAKDFGVYPMTLFEWLRQADADEGTKPGVSRSDSAELRDARRRIKLLEQENEILRRAAAYLSQANLPGKALPARERAGRAAAIGTIAKLNLPVIPFAAGLAMANLSADGLDAWRGLRAGGHHRQEGGHGEGVRRCRGGSREEQDLDERAPTRLR